MFHHPSAIPYSKISICLRNDSFFTIATSFPKPLSTLILSKSVPSPYLKPLVMAYKQILWED